MLLNNSVKNGFKNVTGTVDWFKDMVVKSSEVLDGMIKMTNNKFLKNNKPEK